MADDLDISGGTSSVSTEDLVRAAEQLGRVAHETRAMAAALRRTEEVSTPGIYNTGQALLDIEHAVGILDEVSGRAGALSGTLVSVGQGYIAAEQVIARAVQGAGGALAELVGALLGPLLATSFMGRLTVLVAGAVKQSGGLDMMLGRIFAESGVPSGSPFARNNNGVFFNPLTIPVYRGMAQTLGHLVVGSNRGLGWYLSPGPLQYLFPPARPFEAGADALVGAGRGLGILNETPVRLVGSEELSSTSAPQSYHDRLIRVPHDDLGQPGPQVMIERYSVPGEPDRFSVYVGGTVSFNPGTTSEPWDMTSNLINASGEESGSAASVSEAMAAAGIDKDSPVQFTGFSQGGGTVARIVASEEYNTQGVVTFGGPTGQVPLPKEILTVLVEHADDPVPALGGDQANTDAVLVRRAVFDSQNADTRWAVPSHHIEYYLKTAQIMDESRSPQLDTTIRNLDSFTAGAKLESSTAYRFERVLEKD
ncbi:hypothetical protein BH11ACT5_BH11ACT5_02360 [soil metagenome]